MRKYKIIYTSTRIDNKVNVWADELKVSEYGVVSFIKKGNIVMVISPREYISVISVTEE